MSAENGVGDKKATESSVQIITVTPQHPLWNALLAHLVAVGMARSALEGDQPKPDTHYLAACLGEQIAGHISFRVQALLVEPSALNQHQPQPLTDGDGVTLQETFVQTFAVLEAYRRRGFGRALQAAALEATRALNCCQMRSWSSVDKHANYALKLSMDFAVCPALYPMLGQFAGVFVRRV
jgi:GNAT superfamily N-acetyltransferase